MWFQIADAKNLICNSNMSKTKAKLIKLAQDMEYFYRVLATELIYKYKTIHKGVLLETLEE